MKKILSVALALCLLLATAVSAMAADTVYQDNVAPTLVVVTDAEGSEALALIRDKDGQIIAAVPADSVLRTVCVGERENEDDIAALLETGLVTLMVEDEEILYIPGLVGTDLFYLEIPAEYAEQFADGATLEVTFAPIIMQNGGAVLVLSSLDGVEWVEETDATFPGEGKVTVKVNESGLVAFAVEPGAAYGEVAEEEEITAEVPGATEEEETNPNFTPSASGKPCPEVVPVVSEGEEYAATIVDAEETVVANVPHTPWLVVTALSERTLNPDVMTHEQLEWAYTTICNAAEVGGLKVMGEEDLTLADVINKRFEDAGSDLTTADLTVSDLFEISIYGEYPQYLTKDSGNKLCITFDVEMEQGDTLVVLCASGIDAWHVMDAEDVIINANGTVTLRLQHLGVVTFLVEKPDTIDADAEDVVTAP